MKLCNRLLIRVTGMSSAAIGLSFKNTALKLLRKTTKFSMSTAGPFCYRRNRRRRGSDRREIDARDIDDGLPGGFLVGAIVEVWVELRLNWA